MNDVARYWDSEAKTFDDEPDHGLSDGTIRQAWGSLLLQMLPPAPARVADLGCGTGTLAVLLAQYGYEVLGVDLAPRMIELAREKARLAAIDVGFVVRDVSDPPGSPASFDVVLARHVLWALSDPGNALDRWFRLLGPDGRMVLIEGRWSTGVGMTAASVLSLLDARGRDAKLIPMDDPVYWGSHVSDERYAIVSPASAALTS